MSLSKLFRIVRHLALMTIMAVALQGTAWLSELPGAGATAAEAQERRSLLDLLFRSRPSDAQIQEIPQETRRPRTNAPAPPPIRAPQAEAVEKLDNAHVILVVGDFTAGGLASGLEEAFADVPTIRIEDRSNGSSGFVRNDYYNWPASIGSIIFETKPDLVVMMIGANDRQDMQVDGQAEKVRTEAWDKEYIARINLFVQAVSARKAPLLWVGGPPFRFKSMSTDILAFNEFYRNAVENAGGTFVDIWDGFVDENGAFVLTGSDINGQTVRLRNSDGINFTRDGKRKLAFYVERQIRQIFGDAASPQLTVLAPESYSTMRLPPLPSEVEFVRFDPIPLADPELDGGTTLLGDVNAGPLEAPSNPLQAKSLRNRLVEDGIPPPPQPGRANNFDWPPTGS